MKIKTAVNLSNLTTLEEVNRYYPQSITSIVEAINGNLSFQDNLSTNIQSITFPSASTSVAVTHNLGKLPVGYVVIGKSGNVQIWDGTPAADTQKIYLQASGAVTATVMVIG